MVKKSVQPVWKGPEIDGITQSMLSRFIGCRERFRLRVVEGLRPADTFNHRLEYGQMWHVCEERLARMDSWEYALTEYCKRLCERYKTQQEQVQHWFSVCRVQFPIYAEYWRKHPDVKDRQPLLQEQVFDVPYLLPSGRAVRLRGKWDSVDRIGKGKSAGIYLQENKTKGEIIEEQLKRQLQFDLQTMFYLVALQIEIPKIISHWPLMGVRYNVVRRPLSGGKGSIRQYQPTKSNPQGESKEAFYARVGALIAEDPAYFFMRWKVEVTGDDLTRFQRECLNPLLESLCDWWSWVQKAVEEEPEGIWSSANDIHWRMPYGVYNVLLEGGSSELDEYLATGSELGLERGAPLFTELD